MVFGPLRWFGQNLNLTGIYFLMNTTFIKHDDPGHGWLEVGLADLKLIDSSVKDYSPYSYRKGNRLFLEEDCDASKFVEAWKGKFGSYPKIVHQHHRFDFPFSKSLNGIHE